MILEICPYCHRPFEAKAIASEEVDASDLTREEITPKSTEPRPPFIRGHVGPRAPEAVLTYKCKHCGKEWSKIETKDGRLPEEYSEIGFD